MAMDQSSDGAGTYIAGIKFGGKKKKEQKTAQRTQKAAQEADSSTSAKGSDKINAGAAMAKTAAGGGSGEDMAASGLMTYGASTGNPYLIAAGAGLGVLSGHKKRQREMAEQRVRNEMDRRKRIMDAMANLGTGVGSIG